MRQSLGRFTLFPPVYSAQEWYNDNEAKYEYDHRIGGSVGKSVQAKGFLIHRHAQDVRGVSRPTSVQHPNEVKCLQGETHKDNKRGRERRFQLGQDDTPIYGGDGSSVHLSRGYVRSRNRSYPGQENDPRVPGELPYEGHDDTVHHDIWIGDPLTF